MQLHNNFVQLRDFEDGLAECAGGDILALFRETRVAEASPALDLQADLLGGRRPHQTLGNGTQSPPAFWICDDFRLGFDTRRWLLAQMRFSASLAEGMDAN